jgi:hypothetical protein
VPRFIKSGSGIQKKQVGRGVIHRRTDSMEITLTYFRKWSEKYPARREMQRVENYQTMVTLASVCRASVKFWVTYV